MSHTDDELAALRRVAEAASPEAIRASMAFAIVMFAWEAGAISLDEFAAWAGSEPQHLAIMRLMLLNQAAMLMRQPFNWDVLASPSARPEGLPTGVQPEVIEQGRRIIVEDRELLDRLADYDRRPEEG